MSVKFDKQILEIQDDMVSYRRHIHEYPELGFQEENTASYIEEKLKEFGLSSSRIAKTGVIVTIPGKSSRTLGIRADIDALPVQEVSGRPYGSKNPGIHHACGHDAHIAIALGFAQYYSSLTQAQRPGTVKLFFQPAEEGPGGALPMVKAGALNNPKPEAVIALHVDSNEEVGKVAVREGAFSASSDEIKITISGESGHGAYPHHTKDPIPVAADIITMLQRLITRENDPLAPLVLTIGTINGGTRHNIIAPNVEMTGTLRTFNENIRTSIKHRITEIVSNHCTLMGCKGSTKFEDSYSSGYNDPELTRKFIQVAKQTLGNNLIIKPLPQMGAEDFFEFSDKGRIPVMMFFLGVRNEGKSIVGEHHSPEFDVDEEGFKVGLQLYIDFVNSFFRD